MEISSAFCSPVEQSRASARFCVWRTSRSAMMRARTACGRLRRRACATPQAQPAAQLRRPRHVAGSSLSARCGAGKRALGAARRQLAVQLLDRVERAPAMTAAPASAIVFFEPVQPDGSRTPSRNRRSALAHRASHSARRARAWPASSPNTSRSRKRRRSPAPSRNSRSIAGVSHSTGSELGQIGRSAPARRSDAARGAASRDGSPVRCRSPTRRRRARPWRRRPMGSAPAAFALRVVASGTLRWMSASWRRASRGPATAARSLPDNWSCPCRWGRPAPPARAQTSARPRHRSGN